MARERIAVCLLIATFGCTPCLEPIALVDHDLWTLVAMEDDPFVPSAPEDVLPCDRRDVRPELFGTVESFTIDTNGCNWGTVTQPLPVALEAGDTVRVRAFWFSQTVFTAAEAHLAIQIGDEVVVEQRVPVPSEEVLFDEEIVIQRAQPAESPVYFHIGNHGINTWNILSVTQIEEGACVE